MLDLILVVGDLKKAPDNARVLRYLSQHCAEILFECSVQDQNPRVPAPIPAPIPPVWAGGGVHAWRPAGAPWPAPGA